MNVVGFVSGPALLDAHVAANDPARLRQALQECSDPGLKFRIVRSCGQDYANAPHALALLRARRERPRRRRNEKGDEFPPPHGSYPKANDHRTEYSRSCSGSVSRIAIKSGASARHACIPMVPPALLARRASRARTSGGSQLVSSLIPASNAA